MFYIGLPVSWLVCQYDWSSETFCMINFHNKQSIGSTSTITAFNCEIYYMKFICLVVLKHTVREIGLMLIFYNTFLPFWKVPLYCEALSPYLHVRHGRRHRRRSGWNYGGRMASAEGGSVPSGVRYGEDREDDPQSWAPHAAGCGGEPRPKTDFGVFWRPQNPPFSTYMTKSEGTICVIASPTPNSGELVPLFPRDLRQCWSLVQSDVNYRCKLYLSFF